MVHVVCRRGVGLVTVGARVRGTRKMPGITVERFGSLQLLADEVIDSSGEIRR